MLQREVQHEPKAANLLVTMYMLEIHKTFVVQVHVDQASPRIFYLSDVIPYSASRKIYFVHVSSCLTHYCIVAVMKRFHQSIPCRRHCEEE